MPNFIPSGAPRGNQRDKSGHFVSKDLLSTILTVIMDSELTIRDAVSDDAPAIARVNYLTWLHAYRGLVPDSELDSLNMQSLTDRWRENLNSAHSRGGCLVAVVRDDLVAYSRFYPSEDSDDDQRLVATIGSMYVDPESQGKGIGRKLMGEVLAAAKVHGYAEATLHVLAGNERARKFYEYLGWNADLDVLIGKSGDQTVPKMRYRMSPL